MYQTRRHSGELRQFPTFREAVNDAIDIEVWKISWSVDNDPSCRIRLVRDVKGNRFFTILLI